MKVSNIYTKKVITVCPNDTLLTAAKAIFGLHHKGLPVVKGKARKLIGFITEQDITSQLFPSIKDIMEDYVHESNFENMEENVKQVLKKKVKNVMSKQIIAIHKEDPVLKAESIMKVNEISRLPVVNDKGYLLGILSKGDIFRAIVSQRVRGFA